MEGYNEFDDMGTGYEEAAERYFAQMIDAQERAIIEACPCETAGTIEAFDALVSGVCRSCGWNA
jgi:hypothetical protein